MIRFMTEKECRKDVSKKVPLYIFCIILFHRFTDVELSINFSFKYSEKNVGSKIDPESAYNNNIILWHNVRHSTRIDFFEIHNYSDAIHTYRKLIGKGIAK